MHQVLRLHPDSPCTAAARIEVDVTRASPRRLALRYVVTGATRDLCLPAAALPTRTDGLWRHTCFEAFVRATPGGEYFEFNFAPSTKWAAYRFSGHRSGMHVVDDVDAPHIENRMNGACFELDVLLALDGLHDLADTRPWRLGLSAVLEDASGARSYWALTHPPGQPDFHHPDCFALELPPA